MRELLSISPLLLAMSLTLSGCSTLSGGALPVSQSAGKPSEMPGPIIRSQTPAELSATRAQIEQDPIYLIMAGELEGQADKLPQSAEFYYKAAEHSDDVALLARAAQIALIAKRYDWAFQTAERWVAHDPSSDKAAATLTVSAIQLDNFSAADLALTQWLKRGDANDSAIFNELGAYLDKNVPQPLAIRYTDHLAQQMPDVLAAQIIVAKLDLKFGRLQTAMSAARQIITLDPQNETAYDLLIVATSQANDTDGLVSALKSAHQKFPHTERYTTGLIEAYVRSSKTQAAGHLITDVLRKSPKDPAQLRRIALFALQIERPALARKALFQLEKIPGQRDLAQLLLGRIAAQAGELNTAIKHFNRIPSHSEHYAEARILMAAAYAQSDDLDGAMQSMDIALAAPLDIADKQRLTLAKAGLLQSQGLDQDSLTLLTEAATRWPDASDIQLQRAMLLLKLNRGIEARDVLRQVIHESPDNAAALNALGFTLADENINLNEAEQLVQKALSNDPDNAAYLDSLGWVYYRQGKLDEAAQTLARAYQIAPDPEVGAHWGIVLWHQNKHDEAKAIWQRALELNANLPVLTDAVQKYAPELLYNLPSTNQ